MSYEIQRVMFSSMNGNWRTPQELFDQLDKEFLFDTDVCSDAMFKLKHIQQEPPFTYWIGNQGINESWKGRICYMNPPYGSQIVRWLSKAEMERLWNKVTTVALLPSRTDTKWFWAYCFGKEIRLIKGRLHFSNSGPAPFPSMIVVFKPDKE